MNAVAWLAVAAYVSFSVFVSLRVFSGLMFFEERKKNGWLPPSIGQMVSGALLSTAVGVLWPLAGAFVLVYRAKD